MKCLICNNEFPSHQSFCLHLRSHKTNIQEYTKNILKHPHKCEMCGKETTYRTKIRSFNKYCSSKCAGQSPDTKIKRMKTCLNTYGVSNPNKLPQIKEKTKQTCFRKYGVTNVFNRPETRALTTKIINDNKTELLLKREKTNIEKYGEKCTLNTPENIKKKKETWIHKYGAEHPLQSQMIKDKIKKTCFERYGVSNPLKSEEIYEKVLQTNLKRYGVKFITQNTEILHKVLGSLFRSKPYTLPSGKIIKLLGYEPQFLDYVFDNHLLLESDIDYSPAKIKYINNGEEHYYFPDFYIPKLNLIVEIKSKWTEYQDKNIHLKENACKEMGFNYIRITNNNFDMFSDYIKQRREI